MHTLVALLFSVILLSGLSEVSSFSMGAPDSACQGQTPGHDHAPQTGDSPALFTVARQRVEPGQLISLVLATKDNSTFKGFMVQARNAELKDQQVGSFVLSGDEASYLTCGRGIHNSITHRKSTRKSSIKAKWMAPSNFEGEVIFRYTFLQEYKTFWVGQESERIRVSRSASDEEEVKQDPSDKDLIPSAKSSEDSIKVVQSPAENNLDIDENKIDNSEIGLDESEIVLDDIPQPAQNAIIPKDSLEKTEQLQKEVANTPIYRSSTTTLPTTTARTEAPRREIVTNGALTDPEDPIFDGCDGVKACFGIPSGCVEKRACTVILTYKPDKLEFNFEMKGRSEGYIAMGLSRDDRMGDDLTTNCVVRSNGGVDIVTGYNPDYSGNKQVLRGNTKDPGYPKDGISARTQFSRKDGWISCAWKRKARATIEGSIWDLENEKYHVMLAKGRVNETGDIQKHDSDKIVSSAAQGLGEVGALKSKSRMFIFLHGAFMIGAWICSASLGIIMARYFKQTWTSKRCFNLDQWFIWHRNFMVLTWALTVAGFILIILELKGLSETISSNPHAIIGFVTVGLCFIQPFLALVRCSPNHHLRPLFNWVHWFIGNVAQILAIVCIFYAVDLPKSLLPRPETDWLLVAFVAFHFLTHLVLSGINCTSDNSKIGYTNYPGSMRHMARGHMFPDYEELQRDSPGSTVRLFVFLIYFIVNVIVTAALILLVVLAPTRSKLECIGILPMQNPDIPHELSCDTLLS